MGKKIFAAAAIVAVVASPAHAIPISFDISGSVSYRGTLDLSTQMLVADETAIGNPFILRFTFETDAFDAGTLTDSISHRNLRYFAGDAPSLWSGTLTLVGESLSLTPYESLSMNFIVNDSHGVIRDEIGQYWTNDGFGLSLGSFHDGFPQGFSTSTLGLGSWRSVDTAHPDEDSQTYIDLDGIYVPADALTIPFADIHLAYTQTVYDCSQPGPCTMLDMNHIELRPSTITRTDLSQVSVPEPGTLSLLAMGLLGAGLARRRVGPAN